MTKSIRKNAVLLLGFTLGAVLIIISQPAASLEQTRCHERRTSKEELRFPPLAANALLEGWDAHLVNGDVEVPKKFWGSVIRELQPIRVVVDMVNVAVVTAEDEEAMRGVYFTRTESSYLPRNAKDRSFKWNSCTEMLEFVFNKSQRKLVKSN